MKILCSSDIHSDMSTFNSFASKLKKQDINCGILAGDLIDEYPTSSEAIDSGIAMPDDFKNEYNKDLTLEDLERQTQLVSHMFNDKESILWRTLAHKRDSIINEFIKINKPVFVVLGNHDKME